MIPNDILNDLLTEMNRAVSYHPKMNSAHEGYAVIKEEFDELWDEIKKRECDRSEKLMRKEAIHTAAMAIRFVMDVCADEEGGPK